MRRVLITAALPYANAPLHFGHLVGVYLPADIYARYERLKGSEVFFISGSDEYGVAITLSAELEGKTAKEHVDFFHEEHKRTFEKMAISFDFFSRTTSPLHGPFVKQFFTDLFNNGYIEERETEQLYSEKEGRFLADRYVVGTCPRCSFEAARGDECPKCGASYEATDLLAPRSKLTGSDLVLRTTRHYFLLFDRFKEKLAHFISTRAWKPNVVNFVTHYLEDLRPRAITRDLNWGVHLPSLNGKETQGKVFYVWFDAPIGYISASSDASEKMGEKEKWRQFGSTLPPTMCSSWAKIISHSMRFFFLR